MRDLAYSDSAFLQSKDIRKQAVGAAVRAWRDGVKRQKFEVMLPLLNSKTGMNITDSPGEMRNQFEVARPLTESILRALKAQDGLEGLLKPKFLDVVDAVGRLYSYALS